MKKSNTISFDDAVPGVLRTEHEFAELNTGETVGGNRYLSVSPDGHYIAVVEQVGGAVRVFTPTLAPVTTVGLNVSAVALTNTAIYTLGKSDLQRWKYDGSLAMTSTNYPGRFEIGVDKAHNC